MRIRLFLIFIIIPAASAGQTLVPDTVMPFGACGVNFVDSDTIYSAASLQVMHDTLGFNVFVGVGFNEEEADTFSAAGIYPYPEGTYMDGPNKVIENQQKYSHATYFVTQPEDASRNIRFLTRNGSVDGDYWKCSEEGIMLDNLRFKQYARNGILYTQPNFWGEYYISMQMKRDTTPLDSAALVGVFTAINVDDANTVFLDSIIAYDLPPGQDIYLDLENDSIGQDYYQVFYDTSECGLGDMFKMRFQFEITGVCTVFVDSVVIHCQEGDELIIAREYDDDISQMVDSSRYENKIAGYFLKDSIRPGSYAPAGYIDGIIRDSTADWSYPVRGYSWVCAACGDYYAFSSGYRDFVDIAQPEQLWAYLYPTTENTDYTGYVSGSQDYWQSSLQKWIAEPCDSIRAVLADFDSTNIWFFTPQTWFCLPDSGGCGGEIRRRLTRSEVLCETYIGLCYHPSGIIFYQYDSEDTNKIQGIINAFGVIREDLYDAIKDDINPYIKAIDSTYLGLTWNKAFTINYANGFGSAGTWIDTIYAVSDTPNPDIGWFQVGEFHDGSGDDYLMLVNRACSQGENDSTAAPSITATVKFDSTNLDLGNYVYIIDLADSLRLAGGDTGWVAIPETTYTAVMPDSTIPFTTVFGPGEGRLFKIVQASQISLKDTLAEPGFIYQGSIGMSGDVIIPSGSVFKVTGPARFKIPQCDLGFLGRHQKLVLMK